MLSPRHALVALALTLSHVACGRGPAAAPDVPTPAPSVDAARDAGRIRAGAVRRGPQTRAERYRYGETSTYVDVVRFLDSLEALGAPVTLGTIGRSAQGRDIPYAVASRPAVATPDDARALDRPVVYVQANIHGGEVEGKEALQALLRDLTLGPAPNVLDSIVLIAVPIYNADGNERIALQARNRPEQNGPDLVGDRSNGQGLDLNRDYVKAEAPETRASLAMFDRWSPDVFVDLHTTDGSYHGYALTYAPPLHPAAPLGTYAHDIFLPELGRRVQARHGVATFPYGNFSQDYGADVNTDTVKRGWYTYDHRARYGTNYYGLRGRLAVLSEAYSHDPFERRVRSTYAFVTELLSLVAEQGPRLRAAVRLADSTQGCFGGAARGGTGGGAPHPVCGAPPPVPIRAELTRTPTTQGVLAEDLASAPDSALTEPGVPRGFRRTGHFRTLQIPVYDRFVPSLLARMPSGYLLDASQAAAVALLRRHGVAVERATSATQVDVVPFTVDSIVRAARPFQGHREVQVVGRWATATRRQRVRPGAFVVRTDQPLGLVAMLLLEPQSDDGLATWNVFDRALASGREYPVLRLADAARVRGQAMR
jgi:murein tripeptide amidase MpaA